MLTNFQNITINDHLLKVNYFQTARTICAKKTSTTPDVKKKLKIYNIKMGEIEQVWADSTYMLNNSIKSCLNLLPKSQTHYKLNHYKCDTTNYKITNSN